MHIVQGPYVRNGTRFGPFCCGQVTAAAMAKTHECESLGEQGLPLHSHLPDSATSFSPSEKPLLPSLSGLFLWAFIWLTVPGKQGALQCTAALLVIFRCLRNTMYGFSMKSRTGLQRSLP